jgi:hypothetical protein
MTTVPVAEITLADLAVALARDRDVVGTIGGVATAILKMNPVHAEVLPPSVLHDFAAQRHLRARERGSRLPDDGDRRRLPLSVARRGNAADAVRSGARVRQPIDKGAAAAAVDGG